MTTFLDDFIKLRPEEAGSINIDCANMTLADFEAAFLYTVTLIVNRLRDSGFVSCKMILVTLPELMTEEIKRIVSISPFIYFSPDSNTPKGNIYLLTVEANGVPMIELPENWHLKILSGQPESIMVRTPWAQARFTNWSLPVNELV